MAQSQQCQLCKYWCTNAHIHPGKNGRFGLQSVGSQSWDVIVVLCVTVSAMLLGWSCGAILSKGFAALTHYWCVMFVFFAFRCLTHHPLLVHTGWEHILTYTYCMMVEGTCHLNSFAYKCCSFLHFHLLFYSLQGGSGGGGPPGTPIMPSPAG